MRQPTRLLARPTTIWSPSQYQLDPHAGHLSGRCRLSDLRMSLSPRERNASQFNGPDQLACNIHSRARAPPGMDINNMLYYHTPLTSTHNRPGSLALTPIFPIKTTSRCVCAVLCNLSRLRQYIMLHALRWVGVVAGPGQNFAEPCREAIFAPINTNANARTAETYEIK